MAQLRDRNCFRSRAEADSARLWPAASTACSWKLQCSDGSCHRTLRDLRSDHPVSSHPTIGSGRVAMECRSRCWGLDQRVQLGYHDGPLACTGGDPLGQAMAHVANGKDAGQAGLMDQGRAREWPSSDHASLVHRTSHARPPRPAPERYARDAHPRRRRARSAPPNSPPVVTSFLAEHVRA
jgi:hypothetical protein